MYQRCALQVDLIVCFDSDASPIRNIQRMGRTGRHKAGRVVYIMSQGKEEDSYRKGLQVSFHSSKLCSTACTFTAARTVIAVQLQRHVLLQKLVCQRMHTACAFARGAPYAFAHAICSTTSMCAFACAVWAMYHCPKIKLSGLLTGSTIGSTFRHEESRSLCSAISSINT